MTKSSKPLKSRVPNESRIALTVEEAVGLSGMSIFKIYGAMDKGRLIARKDGARTLILRSDLEAWLNAMPQRPVRAEGGMR